MTTPNYSEQSISRLQSEGPTVTAEPPSTGPAQMPRLPTEASPQYKFSSVPGFFIDYPKAAAESPGGKIATQPNLGLLEQGYDGESVEDTETLPQWARFARHVERLNRQCGEGVSYKVFFVVRHGFGAHNQCMERVESQLWKEYWSHQDSDGTNALADAHLVGKGIAQAHQLGEFWVDGVQSQGIPLPQTIYTSPLARCLETTKLVYMPVFTQNGRTLRPVVKEHLREFLTDHTCDRRSSQSWIRDNYPDCIIEHGFAEADVLWRPSATETMDEQVIRKQKLLEDIFAHHDSVFVGLTTHSYALSAILKVTGAPEFRVGEGAMVPLFVKGEKLS